MPPRYSMADVRGLDMSDEERTARRRSAEVLATLHGILDAVRSAGADKLTASQDRDFTAGLAELDEIRSKFRLDYIPEAPGADLAARRTFADTLDKRIREPQGEPTRPEPSNDGGYSRSFGLTNPDGSIRVLTKDQRLADILPPGEPGAGLTLDRFVRAVVTGEWHGIPTDVRTRAMAVGSDVQGGYLVPSPLAARVIDLARNASVVVQAGAQTVPMDTSTLTIARVASDPTAAWHVENAAVTATDMNLEAVILRSRTVVALLKGSLELFEDAQNLSTVVENAMAKALALELDRAALCGTGAAGEPLGIVNQPGVTTTGSIGAPASYVAFADTPTQTLREANAAGPYSFIASPRTFADLDALVTGITGDLTRLKPPPAWDAYQKFPSNQVPNTLGGGGAESEAFIGDFRQLMIGTRTSFVLEASRVAADTSSSAFTNLQVWIRAYLRTDVALAHPDHFVVLTGITS